MMTRPKKDGKLLSMKLDATIHENLELFCKESGMTKTMAIEKILERYFANYYSKPEDERKLF